MRCSGFAEENYDLYSLGVLEPAEAVPIDEHLALQCQTCWMGVRHSLRLWTPFGPALAGDAELPPFRLGSIDHPRGRSRLVFLPARRAWLGAIAASLLCVATLVTWRVNRPVVRPTPRAPVETARLAERDRLQQELIATRQQRDEAAKQLNRLSEQLAVVTARGHADQRRAAQFEQTVRALRAENTQTQAVLVRTQDRLTAVEAQLETQRARLAAASAERDSLAGQARQAADRQQTLAAQIATLRAQLAQSEAQRARLEQVVQQEQRRSRVNLRVVSALASPDTRLVRVRGTEAAPDASGYLLVSSNNSIVFSASNLPALPAGRAYQLWLLRARAPAIVSGGVFAGSAAGPQLSARAGVGLNDLRGVAVTDEPEGGSAQPTGHKVLVGTPQA